MSFRIGRVWGIPIFVDISWFLILALVTWVLAAQVFPQLLGPASSAGMNWLAAFVTALFFFGSVLVHELAHSLVAIRNGLSINGITLFLLGGVSQITREPDSPGLELRMSIAGPAMSVALGAIFWGLGIGARAAHLPPHVVAGALYLGLINVLLGVFNLIPGFPLDGGRVLRAILWMTTGSLQRASRYATISGQAFGYVLMVAGGLLVLGSNFGGLWWVLIGWFLVSAAKSSYQQVVLQRALSGVPIEQIMQRDVPHVAAETPLREVVDEYMMHQDYPAYPVVEGDDLLGVITVDDVRAVPRAEWETVTARQAARSPDEHRVIDEKEDAWQALTHMLQDDTRRLLVVHDGHLEGVVSRDGILQLVRYRMRLQGPDGDRGNADGGPDGG